MSTQPLTFGTEKSNMLSLEYEDELLYVSATNDGITTGWALDDEEMEELRAWLPSPTVDSDTPAVEDPLANEKLRAVYPTLRFFEYAHLPERLREVSKSFCVLAYQVASEPDGSTTETSVALRKLLEAKDAAVRAAI